MIFFQTLVEQRARIFFDIVKFSRPSFADTKISCKLLHFFWLLLFTNQLQQKLKHQKIQNVMIFSCMCGTMMKIQFPLSRAIDELIESNKRKINN